MSKLTVEIFLERTFDIVCLGKTGAELSMTPLCSWLFPHRGNSINIKKALTPVLFQTTMETGSNSESTGIFRLSAISYITFG